MEMQPCGCELLDSYAFPFAKIAGDRRIGWLLGDMLRGIINFRKRNATFGEHLATARRQQLVLRAPGTPSFTLRSDS